MNKVFKCLICGHEQKVKTKLLVTSCSSCGNKIKVRSLWKQTRQEGALFVGAEIRKN